MKRVLLISYYFPPLGGIGSLRATSFATYLPGYDWDVTVLAPSGGAYFRDATLAFEEGHVIRAPSLELSRVGKQLLRTGGDDTTEADVRGARSTIRQLAREHLYFPDAQIGWYPAAVLAARRHVRRAAFDAVFSTSFPVTAHLVARNLHRRHDLPWVAEFRDPWSARLSPDSPVRARAVALEQAIAREASALVTVSQTWAEMFSAEWQREVAVITNGHDGDTARFSASLHEPISLGYLGTYYPDSQDLDAVWSAVAALNQEDAGRVRQILFIGDRNASVKRIIDAHGLNSLLKFTGFLAHSAATAELSRCTALLVAGPAGSVPLEKGVIAAKIFDYLATCRPIIYVGDPSSDAARILAGFAGTYIIPRDDVRAALDALAAVTVAKVERNTDALSRSALTSGLADLLDSVRAGTRRDREI